MLANDVVDKVPKLYLVLLSLVYTFRLEKFCVFIGFFWRLRMLKINLESLIILALS